MASGHTGLGLLVGPDWLLVASELSWSCGQQLSIINLINNKSMSVVRGVWEGLASALENACRSTGTGASPNQPTTARVPPAPSWAGSRRRSTTGAGNPALPSIPKTSASTSDPINLSCSLLASLFLGKPGLQLSAYYFGVIGVE